MTPRNRQEPGTSTGAKPLAVRGVGVPEGFGIVLDDAARRTDGGSTLIGGSPLTVLRLSAAGTRVVDDLVAGGPVPPTGAGNVLVRRLLNLGLAHPRPPPVRPSRAVTVVVPVRDDPVGLGATLARLGPAHDIVVVDDGSVERVDHEGVRVVRLDRSRGPGGARQVGWQAATTEVVAFVDAGCQPEPGWLEPLLAHLADPAVAAAAPRVRPLTSPTTPRGLGAYEQARSPLDLGPSAAIVRPRSRVPYVPTAALVVRRAAIEEVGGFDPALRFGEDVDLVWRLVAAGWVVRYEPAAIVGHPVRPSVGALLRQRLDYGSSAAPLAAHHGEAVAPLTVSAWSAAAWALAALGHPVVGLIVAGASTAAVAPRLRRLRHPWGEALRLAGGGHLRSGVLIAEACRRTWWPLVALACLCSRRARRAAPALLLPLVLERRPPTAPGLPAWLALRLADDLAYGLGVGAGVARARSTRALHPRLTSWPARRHPPNRQDERTGGGTRSCRWRGVGMRASLVFAITRSWVARGGRPFWLRPRRAWL